MVKIQCIKFLAFSNLVNEKFIALFAYFLLTDYEFLHVYTTLVNPAHVLAGKGRDLTDREGWAEWVAH